MDGLDKIYSFSIGIESTYKSAMQRTTVFRDFNSQINGNDTKWHVNYSPIAKSNHFKLILKTGTGNIEISKPDSLGISDIPCEIKLIACQALLIHNLEHHSRINRRRYRLRNQGILS